ncbi:hypothetical protein [Ktedonobacter robiniae]|uniref:Uncharacterized protein n=1 Tax=Ktedonobacter robiniae TaxID=2778365 RepID=A0ABQ3V691_9CHLR|nr:hypothetical protein [Ktedonobacter robiniae]GHO60414.1 hypothetical protein KSB_88890 [Ktedonobacter robiniae]
MALSLDAIYQPIAEFFLQLFETNATSPLLFRFDKFGSVVSDEDFIDPNHPELGYLPALAMEKFSDLVNHIPVDTHDNVDILLSADTVDSAYFFRLLTPALPYLSPGTDDATKQAMIDAFNLVKANAVKLWDNVKAESITGLMLQYKPSLATPQNWYDRTKKELWTHHAFQVTETQAKTNPGTEPIDKLWTLKIHDDTMANILEMPELKKEVKPDQPDPTELPPIRIADRILELHKHPDQPQPDVIENSGRSLPSRITEAGSKRLTIPTQENALHNRLLRDSALLQPSSLETERLAATPIEPEISTLSIRDAPILQPTFAKEENIDFASGNLISRPGVIKSENSTLHDSYLKQSHTLAVTNKLLVNQYLGAYAPTNSVQTSSISISFDYCLIHIRRPWYMDEFINARSWYIPTVPKGQVTSSGAAGNFPFIPIGFVAIRNLSIVANWTEEDRTNASQATSFGPFKVTTGIVNNTLSHEGLQIIGWMLQKMPDLPPNGSQA